MSAVARKPDGTLVITVRITLKPGRDDRLIELVENAPPRRLAASIREAMRNGVTIAYEDTNNEDELELDGLGFDI